MKQIFCLLLGMGCIASTYGQLTVQSIAPRKEAPASTEAIAYDSLTNIRVNGDLGYYKGLVGQHIFFYPRDINRNFKEIAYTNFYAEQPSIVRIDTTWLRKPRKKIRPEDFRVDTLYSDAYHPHYFKRDEQTACGCTAWEHFTIQTKDVPSMSSSGYFTPMDNIEGKSFEIVGIEKCKIEKYDMLLFRLRDTAGAVFYWLAHWSDNVNNLRGEYYPVVIDGFLEKYQTTYKGKDFFLTGRKPEAKGYTSSFGLPVKTTQAEEIKLEYNTELHCTDIRLIADGTGYAIPSLIFEKKSDNDKKEFYIPLCHYPTAFGVTEHPQSGFGAAFMEELIFTPSEEVYAKRAEEEKQREQARLQHEKEQKERKAKLYKKYGKYDADLILDNRVRIGMTREMCRESWGSPDDINSTSGSWGVHEQWVYGMGSYLYFENGRLSSIQN